MKVAQKNSTKTNTVSVALPHPLTYRTSNRPLRTASPMNCPVLLQCPDQNISNTKVVWNRSTTSDTQPTRVSDVHDTPGLIFPPPDTLSGNHPGAGIHPRMNFRSEHRALYYVRTTFAIHLSC